MSKQFDNFLLGKELSKEAIAQQEARGSRLNTITPDAVQNGVPAAMAATQHFNMNGDEYRALTMADTTANASKFGGEMFHTVQKSWQRWCGLQTGRMFSGAYFSALADAATSIEGADNGFGPVFTTPPNVDADATNAITMYDVSGHLRHEAQTYASDEFLFRNPQAAQVIQKALTGKMDELLEGRIVDHVSANVAATGILSAFSTDAVLDHAMKYDNVTFVASEAASVREMQKAIVDYGIENVKVAWAASADGAEEAFFFADDAVQLHAAGGFDFMRNQYTYASEGLVEFKAGAIAAPFIANPNTIVRYGA